MRPLSLTDAQIAQLQGAAAVLPPSQRGEFLRGVAGRLGHEPSNDALQLAIDQQLSINRLPTFMCDSASIKEK